MKIVTPGGFIATSWQAPMVSRFLETVSRHPLEASAVDEELVHERLAAVELDQRRLRIASLVQHGRATVEGVEGR